jgi:hypothetical protein
MGWPGQSWGSSRRHAGNNAYLSSTTELAGNPRVVSGTVDMGAYEFHGPGWLISYARLQQYGLPTYGSADDADADYDGMSNWREWRSKPERTSAPPALRLISAAQVNAHVTVTWRSVVGVDYSLERSTNLGPKPASSPLGGNVSSQPGSVNPTGTNASGRGLLYH